MDDAVVLNSEIHLSTSRHYWDNRAASFDNEPDHGLRDPLILDAWTELLKTCLPSAKAEILDIGCGTGSLSTILAGLGHDVTGIDVSTAMISLAEAKVTAAGQRVGFHVMDAAYPQLSSQQFDAIVCRHVLWALPDIAEVLQRWTKLLKRGGRLVLIEGFWRTGAGLHAREIVGALPSSVTLISVEALSAQPNLWGGEVGDERYVIIADLRP
jgi:2-polyprenyl-3-methyl-5-hydroxy-6-metoxy-1,4-benzoquinol methylase